jgi:hypothetical protein
MFLFRKRDLNPIDFSGFRRPPPEQQGASVDVTEARHG